MCASSKEGGGHLSVTDTGSNKLLTCLSELDVRTSVIITFN